MRILLLLLGLFSFSSTIASQDLPLSLLKLAPGFSIEIYAAPVPSARQMTLGKNNIVYVGSHSAGRVYALVPSPQGIQVMTIASNLNAPNGVAYHQGALYVAEINRILRFDDIDNHLKQPPTPVVMTASLPTFSHHGYRYIKFGPDQKLYVGIGVPCNVCLNQDQRLGTILRMNADGSHAEIYVKGIRNSMGFDWDARTQGLWFTDNGRDYMGDNTPPDKLNFAPNLGMDFGFPYYDGKDLPDPEFGKLKPNLQFTPPTYALPAHVAALGMTFYSGKQFPANYHQQIFLAEHGSWNRSAKIGYQVIFVELKNNKVLSAKPFVTGWLQGQQAWGRPVDVLVMPDGSLLISDDTADVIYRVRFQN